MFQTKAAPMTKLSSQVQEVNTVYKTTDLSIFKSIDGNRVPNLQHIKRLAQSINVYGMKCNPILVNEQMEVIDGQHRLAAAIEAKSFVYFVVVKGYDLKEVHTLNLNQKNWAKKDFMEGYANMGIESYVKLRKFSIKNTDFSFTDCISLCQNRGAKDTTAQKFEEGTWNAGCFNIAQDYANKIRMIKPYYIGFSRSNFVTTMISLFNNKNFDFNEFMHKLRLQPTSLVDCVNREQYKTLIEDIYNWKRSQKVNLRY